MQVVFENEHFIIVYKPAGWLSVPSSRGIAETTPVLGVELEKKLKTRVYPIHRLDRDVSGLILFALSSRAQSAAEEWFAKKQIRKIYEGITEDEGARELTWMKAVEWRSILVMGKKRAFEADYGKPAKTIAMPVRLTDKGILWQLEPVTGRRHQLRYELFKRGFPIVGDKLYGAKTTWREEGIALRAKKLEFLSDTAVKKWGLPAMIEVE